MTYRDPQPRRPRLFFVVLSYTTDDEDGEPCEETEEHWVWATESSEALDEAIELSKTETVYVWSSYVVCGEDFAEREAAGPDAVASITDTATTPDEVRCKATYSPGGRCHLGIGHPGEHLVRDVWGSDIRWKP
jgi:hypothetical protein